MIYNHTHFEGMDLYSTDVRDLKLRSNRPPYIEKAISIELALGMAVPTIATAIWI